MACDEDGMIRPVALTAPSPDAKGPLAPSPAAKAQEGGATPVSIEELAGLSHEFRTPLNGALNPIRRFRQIKRGRTRGWTEYVKDK